MTVSIRTEVDSIAVRADGPATGNVWLIVAGQDFPAHRWNDFIVVVLGSWGTALLRLVRKASEREKVHFMEGTYLVEVSNLPGGRLRFRALEGPHRDRERIVAEESAVVFMNELLVCSHDVLDSCRRHNWWSSDAENLHVLAHELDTFLRALRPN